MSDIPISLEGKLKDPDQVTRFFDQDECVVVGWKDSGEILAHFGSNTELARELADSFAWLVRQYG